MTREEYLEAIFEVTTGEPWVRVQDGLQADINSLIAQELAENDFAEIKELRGFRRALEYVHGLREIAKTERATNASV